MMVTSIVAYGSPVVTKTLDWDKVTQGSFGWIWTLQQHDSAFVSVQLVFDDQNSDNSEPQAVLKIQWSEFKEHSLSLPLMSTITTPTVLEGDLNNDQKPDLFLRWANSGNGLAGETSLIAFVISNLDGYQLTHFLNFDWTNEVPQTKNAITYFVASQYIEDGPQSLDKKPHRYFLSRILQMTKDGIKENDSVLPGFPQVSILKNNRRRANTTLLTAQQKRDLIQANALSLKQEAISLK